MPETDGKPTIRTEGSEPLKDCDRRFSNIEGDILSIRGALFGPNGTNGLVRKVDQIEYQTGLIRFVGQGLFGIAISVLTLVLVKVMEI